MSNNILYQTFAQRVPFRSCDGMDAETLAHALVECFNFIKTLPDQVYCCFEAACLEIGVTDDSILLQAGQAIARAIDAGQGDGEANPYHNKQHFCEVMLSSLCLGRQAHLEQSQLMELLVAALIHDFHHDGSINGEQAFRLELLAITHAEPYFQAAGVSPEQIERISALVLATDIRHGVPFAVRCYRHHQHPHKALPRAEHVPPALHALQHDAALSLRAVLLAEADILPSVGLTHAYSMYYQCRLEEEWGVPPLGAAGKLAFLDGQFGEFAVSKAFNANVDRLRIRLRQFLDDEADTEPTASK